MIDWGLEWKTRLLASGFRPGGQVFLDQKAADRYNESREMWRWGESNVRFLDPCPEWSVLEVGPGPGNLTVPLARRCRKVTAVELSEAMAGHLVRNAIEAGLGNVDVINSAWEEAPDLPRHDLVLASYCLKIPEMTAALLKMNSLAIKKVALFWYSGPPRWERAQRELAREAGFEVRPYPPFADVLFNILTQMDLRPELSYNMELPCLTRFSGTEEAVAYFRDTMLVPDVDDGLLRGYVERNCRPADGGWIWSEDPRTYAMITWVPREPRLDTII
ncbi:MAG: methyltransferase domain-containing protein [Methanomassiliicoccales archaeon]|nr:methyltransferase domain-containing protein [Methanomassiliicoccales archaeon]